MKSLCRLAAKENMEKQVGWKEGDTKGLRFSAFGDAKSIQNLSGVLAGRANPTLEADRHDNWIGISALFHL